jgi:hypothetical protein
MNVTHCGLLQGHVQSTNKMAAQSTVYFFPCGPLCALVPSVCWTVQTGLFGIPQCVVYIEPCDPVSILFFLYLRRPEGNQITQ